MKIGSRVKELRKALGWSGVYLAEKAGIGQATLSALEVRGSNRSEKWSAIAAAMGVTVEALASDCSVEELLRMRDRQKRVVDFLAPADRELLADIPDSIPSHAGAAPRDPSALRR